MTSAEARCLRVDRCVDAIEVKDEAGAFIERQGALLSAKDGGSGLCRVCATTARDATLALPKMWGLLDAAKQPRTTQLLRDTEIPSAPRIKLHSPAPLNITPLDMQILLVAEVDTIATDLAETVGALLSWPTSDHARLLTSTAFLAEHFDHLLAVEHDLAQPARSTGEERWQGHNPDRLACVDGVWWVWRTGVEMACRLWDLHEDAARMTGSAEGDVVLPVPCPACRKPRKLVRDHAYDRVRCRGAGCDFMRSDDDYEKMRSSAPSTFLEMADKLAEAA